MGAGRRRRILLPHPLLLLRLLLLTLCRLLLLLLLLGLCTLLLLLLRLPALALPLLASRRRRRLPLRARECCLRALRHALRAIPVLGWELGAQRNAAVKVNARGAAMLHIFTQHQRQRAARVAAHLRDVRGDGGKGGGGVEEDTIEQGVMTSL